MDVFYPFIHKSDPKTKEEMEPQPLYIEMVPPPPPQEEKEEDEEPRVVIIEIL